MGTSQHIGIYNDQDGIRMILVMNPIQAKQLRLLGLAGIIQLTIRVPGDSSHDNCDPVTHLTSSSTSATKSAH